MNLCQAKLSCSACCGLYNLKYNHQETSKWLHQNTKEFLDLNLENAENIVQYRKSGEQKIENSRIDKTIYVCPFIGYIDKLKSRSGCLLHPVGSPHPQISVLKHPQNFSFYGESICQAYDCKTKETKISLAHRRYNQRNYGATLANYKMLTSFKDIQGSKKAKYASLYGKILSITEKLSTNITSFETFSPPYLRISKQNKIAYFLTAQMQISNQRKKGIRKIIQTYARRYK